MAKSKVVDAGILADLDGHSPGLYAAVHSLDLVFVGDDHLVHERLVLEQSFQGKAVAGSVEVTGHFALLADRACHVEGIECIADLSGVRDCQLVQNVFSVIDMSDSPRRLSMARINWPRLLFIAWAML